jgi:hypothetical protein
VTGWKLLLKTKNCLSLKLNKFILFIYFILSVTVLTAQENYPQGYFLFPIKPGEVNYLSANMGELRTNHFHGGIDIKTDKKIGYPVFASAEGYISRIKVSTFGYGNVVYITHPNNLVTVYAHLDKFNTAIGDYVRQKQYEQQTFQIELRPSKIDLLIRKGEIIGLAGNSGSSGGPHLHYEIRDTTDKVLNPALFGFKEIHDDIAPVFNKIALTTHSIDSRVNNEFGRTEFNVLQSGSTYTIPNKISAQGIIGLELKAFDKKNNTSNTYGIMGIEVFVDDKEFFTHNLTSFTFNETRCINVHINYPVFISSGSRFERCYISDGNKLSTYKTNTSRGKIIISENKIYKIKIKIRDEYNNTSVLSFDIQGDNQKVFSPLPISPSNVGLKTEIHENTLKLVTKCAGEAEAYLFFQENPIRIQSSYLKGGEAVYLYDLRKGLPDSASIGTQKEVFNFIKMIPSGTEQQLSYKNISLKIPANSLFDTLYLQLKTETRDDKTIYHMHHTSVPLFDSMAISIKPYDIADPSKSFLYSLNKNKLDFEGGEWKGDKIELKTKNFGKFTFAEDTIKPSIKLVSNYGNSIQFNISDNLSGIGSFRASLNGYWVLMNYDHKKNLIWSERLDKTVPLKGNFVLEVTDNAGNINTFTVKL